jgi:hypothetical protein
MRAPAHPTSCHPFDAPNPAASPPNPPYQPYQPYLPYQPYIFSQYDNFTRNTLCAGAEKAPPKSRPN